MHQNEEVNEEYLKAFSKFLKETHNSMTEIGEALKSILKRVEESDNDKKSN